MSLFYHIVLIAIVHYIHTCIFTTKYKLFSRVFGSVQTPQEGGIFTLKMLINWRAMPIVVLLYS